MGGSRGGDRVAATTHQLQQQQCHNGENHRPIAKVTAAAAPVLLLSRKKRINVAQSHGLAQCPLSWLPFHASLALNLALVYYICLSLSPDRALQHDDHGIRCSSFSNHHQQEQEQQLLHRSPHSAAASPNVFCNNTRLNTSFSRDPWEEPVVLQADDDSPCVSCAPAPVLEGSSYVSFSALDHARECSSNGHFVVSDQQQQKKAVGRRIGACHCHPCFMGPRCAEFATNCILNLSIGDPTIFESYWLTLGSQATTVIPAWQGMSYFAHKHNAFLFVDHHLELTIRELHTLVGNAVTQDRYILLGVGSTQLFQAAIYALAANLPENSTPTTSDPIKIVSAVPFYSAYAEAVDYQKSAKYKWAGDATKFQQVAAAGGGGGGRNHDRAASFIEVVTSPSNPEGSNCQAVLHHQEGGAAGGGPQQGSSSSTIHDLAYYWPQYTPITAPADNPLMLFTFSKITGHAGTRLGWAIVEDKRIAMKMFEYIRVNTLGVSQDAQRRAFTLIRTIIDDIERIPTRSSDAPPRMPFFHYIQALLEERWRRIVSVLEGNSLFTLPVYDEAFCTFLGKAFRPNPAFLWLECTNGQDCGELLLKYGIATREGPSFGVSSAFVRLSLLDRDPLFDLLLQRLASIR
ncbi:unnamed protein product [Sphagnum troendelagicum]|uniref:Alliinase C-terminal domain-containing protein n=1 Tax=Sphagnum troendelagicum TaxID=128251 RepID=A0ABP0V3B5_9BRYO